MTAFNTATIASFFVLVGLSSAARAEDGRALLRDMSDYMADQQAFSFTYRSSIGVVTEDFQKLQFVSSGAVTVNRPDKLCATRTGGFADIELLFDGRTLTVVGKNLEAYAQFEAEGTLDDTLDLLYNAGANAPGADIVSSDIYSLLMKDASGVEHVASANVGGIPCEYLTIRKSDVGLQIWIEVGERPIPRRYVITSKHVSQAPEYILEIDEFGSGTLLEAAEFRFEANEGMRKVDMSALVAIDGLPNPSEAGDIE
ncbi:DUF2092 domain-containing protein [Aurantimonas endophytica]|nr:DUF2092 domain-containing protein [Aurantimonas endophytica]